MPLARCANANAVQLPADVTCASCYCYSSSYCCEPVVSHAWGAGVWIRLELS